MKVVEFTHYGSPDVLHLTDRTKPIPKGDEVLVRVRATPVNYGDLTARKFALLSPREFNMPGPLYIPARLGFGWNKPRTTILGSELAGDVEAVGDRVSRFKPGDAIFAYVGMAMGANAEYVCLRESGTIALKPTNLSYDEAATLPYGAVMAGSLLRRANLKPGHKILINGASGGIGSMAVQLARHAGAEVTGVCSTDRLEYVRSLGAAEVIDYTQADFTQNGETYDVIFDILGRTSFARCRHSLKADGILLFASFKSRALLDMILTGLSRQQKVICAMSDESAASLEFVKSLTEAGEVRTRIDKRFALKDAAAAHWYMESGRKTGHVVLTL